MLIGCANGTPSLPNERPDEVGVIKEIREPGGIGQPGGGIQRVGLLRILVQGDRTLPTGEPRLLLVTIGEDTQILQGKQTSVRSLKHSDLRVGQEVQVWFRGAVERSYPGQAYGRVVVVTE